jgi:hypothetical protein
MKMRAVLGKYWPLYVLGISAQLAVILAILLRMCASNNSLASRLLDFIYNKTDVIGGPAIFGFLVDWAEVISIAAVYIIAVPILLTILQNRRKQALTRIHLWAMDALQKLMEASKEDSIFKQMNDWEERLHSIIEKSDDALADTKIIGNGIKPKVEKAVDNLLKLEDSFHYYPDVHRIRTLLLRTLITFREISTTAFDALNYSHKMH